MGKNYVENSLKRFLKKKVKITMGFVVAFMITGSVGFADTIKEAVVAGGNKIPINDKNFDIEVNANMGGLTYSLASVSKGKIDISSEEINIKSSSDAKFIYGGLAQGGGILNIGNDKTRNIFISASGGNNSEYVLGLNLDKGVYQEDGINKPSGGFINVTGKNVVIHADAANEGTLVAGVYCITAGIGEKDTYNSKINFNTENLEIKATGGNSAGIIAWSKGEVLMNKGNITITADDVIHTRWAKVHINENNNSQNIIKLNGNIKFQYSGESGTTVNSDVIVYLSNPESKFTGKIYTEIVKEELNELSEDELKYKNMKLGLFNGGTWNVTGDSLVNDLTLDGGVINILQTKETGQDVETGDGLEDYLGRDDSKTVLNVDNLSGKGAVNFEAKVSKEGIEVAEGNLRVRSEVGVAKGTALKVGLLGVNADDLAANDIVAKDALNKLVGKVTGDGVDNITQTAVIERGTLTGEITAELNKDGFTNMKQAQDTPTAKLLKDLTAINYLSWKQEMSSLSQRMGELRDSSAEHGVWARVYGGKVENGSQYDNEYQTYQVGYDKKYTVDNGRVYLGYLVSYTDGETDYSYGTGENYSVGAGIYATWMNNNGHYVDVLYKVSRLNNKFDMKDVEDVKGDYDTYGISLSAEYGKRFDITEKWFAEPSVGMHLGRLGDETYTTDGGIEISQDSIYTAEGRVGAAVGYKFSDKGNIYARTHVVKEFAGEVDTEYERNGAYNSTSEDFGDTWFEFGVGVNYRFTENMNVYADIERTGDSTVETKWQGNLGFRYEF